MNDDSSRNRNRLTPKERIVYDLLISTSLSIKEIAVKLGSEYNTVRTQVERIFRKLGVHSRAELILKGNRPLPPPTTPGNPAMSAPTPQTSPPIG